MRLKPPPAVIDIARKLESAGHEVWAVGGAVRDALLELTGGDWDLATNARPAQVRDLFKRTIPVGIEHGTVGVLARDGVMYEVTTFRRDVETSGRHAVVEFADRIEDDLARRDFTFNAIAWRPTTEELRDPFGGFDDLRRARLRTVGEPAERFAEDYLRVLRALRFAGHFVLDIEEATWRALRDAVPHLPVLSAERVREELFKVLGRTPHASAALRLYAASSALTTLYPELAATIGIDPQVAGQGAGSADDDAWTRGLRAVDAISTARPLLRLAALLHTVGMPAARAPDLRGGWRFTGHERAGAVRAEALLRRLKTSNDDTARIVELVRRQSDLFPPDAPDAGVRRWLRDSQPVPLNDLFRLRIALWRARPVPDGDRDLRTRWQRARAVLRSRPPLDTGALALDGGDLKTLGLRPGPRFGEILRALLERVLDDPARNERDTLLDIVRRELLEEDEREGTG